MATLGLFLDTSVVVPLFLPDVFVARAKSLLKNPPETVLVSDFVAAEFCSVVGIRLRNKALSPSAAREAFSNFDIWSGEYASRTENLPEDIQSAMTFLRRLDLNVRAPDAINLAVAHRLGAALATFDVKMAASARKLGIRVHPI